MVATKAEKANADILHQSRKLAGNSATIASYQAAELETLVRQQWSSS
jgi:hypothetical protein